MTPWPWPIATMRMRWSRPTFRGMRSRCRSSEGTIPSPLVLPAVEIVAPGGFYDFAAKYEREDTQYLCPAPLTAAVTRQIRALALRTYEVLGCEGAARVDFRITPRGRPFVLEINTAPGMTETSLLPMAAARAGIDYDELTERILESALARAARFDRPSGEGKMP